MDYEELRNEIDLLQGSINRMMVSDDERLEVDHMFSVSIIRLLRIYEANIDRLTLD